MTKRLLYTEAVEVSQGRRAQGEEKVKSPVLTADLDIKRPLKACNTSQGC